MNEIKTFNFDDQLVRTLKSDDEIWFIGKDVAKILGYSNPRDAILKHVDTEDKNSVAIRDGNKGNPNQTVINESGVYALIFGSKLPDAKKFKHWVTSEVLPQLRKTGSYATKEMSSEELMAIVIDNLDEIKKQIEELGKAIDAPKFVVEKAE